MFMSVWVTVENMGNYEMGTLLTLTQEPLYTLHTKIPLQVYICK